MTAKERIKALEAGASLESPLADWPKPRLSEDRIIERQRRAADGRMEPSEKAP